MRLESLEDRSLPSAVGYYDMGAGQGSPTQEAPIRAAGHTPVNLTDLTTADLAGIDVLTVQNPDNFSYGAEYLSRLSDIQSRVFAGMTLIIHDRYVDAAETILPDGGSFNIVRSFSEDSSIDVRNLSSILVNGPGGVIGDSTLDGGNSSNHGFALAGSLPGNADLVLSTNDPTHIVTFSYRFGAGSVIYSSIPLDFHLLSSNNFRNIYAPNVVAYGVSLLNLAPVANAGGPYTVAEGDRVTLSGSGSDPNGDPLTFAWDLNNDGTFETPGPVVTFSAAGREGPGSQPVVFRVTDNRGASATSSATVNITNVAPSAVVLNSGSTSENGTFDLAGSFTDPGSLDPHTVVVNWGDGSPAITLSLPPGALTFTASHQYADDNPSGTAADAYGVAVVVSDDDGGSVGALTAVTVHNVPPSDLVLSGGAVSEDGTVTVSGSFTDPGTQDTHAVTINWADGSPATVLNLAAGVRTFSASHRYLDDNPSGTASDVYPVGVTVTDDDTGSAATITSVTVNNVAPAVTLDAVAAVNENGLATLSGTISDPGSQDTFTLAINWGDPSSPGNTQSISLGSSAISSGGVTWDPASRRFSVQHQYLDDNPTASASDSYSVGVTVTDDDTGTGNAGMTVTVNNVPPANVAVSATPGTVNENGSVALSGSFTDPGTLDTHTLVITWGDGSPNTTLSLAAGVRSFNGVTHQYTDDNPSDTYTISVIVTDKDGQSGSGSTCVTVNNVAPSNVVLNSGTISENGTFTLNGSFADPGTQDTHTVTISWGPGEGSTTLTLAAGVLTFSSSHQYLDDNPSGTAGDAYPVTVAVTDDDQGAAPPATAGTTVTVNNLAPTGLGLSLSAASISESGSTTLSGSFADAGTLDSHTVVINWGDGSANTTITVAAGSPKAFGASHQYLDDGPSPGNGTAEDTYAISVTVTDDDTGSAGASASLTVNNLAPVATLTGPPIGSVYAAGSAITLTGSFTDVGAQDTHTCLSTTPCWKLETRTTSPASTVIELGGTIAESGGSGTVSGSLTAPATAGVYFVTLKVKDDDTGVGTASTVNVQGTPLDMFLVVYDPSEGFVTGGGWINSPAGAYIPDPSLAGKASFGFVSKYLPGRITPSGNTEFQFKAGNLNFKSTAPDGLVVAGARAQYQGTGTINGVGGYSFRLTAIDGQVSGGGGVDRFRIKIWGSGGVVYDNQMGASDDADATTALGGGSIVIHRNALDVTASGAARPPAPEPLTPDLLQPLVAEASARWQATGLDPQQLDVLSQVRFQVTDLAGSHLGMASSEGVWIDWDAAGYGWFIDATPADDAEYPARPGSAAYGRMDLLTVVAHELGHVLGLEHSHDADDLMAETLAAGIRRMPAADVDHDPVVESPVRAVVGDGTASDEPALVLQAILGDGDWNVASPATALRGSPADRDRQDVYLTLGAGGSAARPMDDATFDPLTDSEDLDWYFAFRGDRIDSGTGARRNGHVFLSGDAALANDLAFINS